MSWTGNGGKPVDGRIDLEDKDDIDKTGERVGEWTQSLSGREIYVEDPRPGDFDVGDVANGLAKAGRYGDQIPVEIHYSVAEHSVLLADYAEQELGWSPVACLAVLFHDAPEFILKDQHRALKAAIRPCYKPLEEKWHGVLSAKYGYSKIYERLKDKIKELDVRIVYHEKRAVQRSQLEWAYDKYPPLDGITIQLWQPTRAKFEWLKRYHKWTRMAGLDEEGYQF
jgi:hypothetical protein